jgi:molybdate-binding protein/transcriptional regulator with XRE-family HTH domain
MSYAARIMAESKTLETRVRAERELRGWSQEELARRSGLSRAGISAIEMGRLVPSTAAALALAAAFGSRVEDLFRLPRDDRADAAWAWQPRAIPCRYWRAEVGGRIWLYPVEATTLGTPPHDGTFSGTSFQDRQRVDPTDSLVLACCDPASGLLASELAREANVRLLVLPRSSRAALSLLEQGLVHVAGLHLGGAGESAGNAAAVRSTLPGRSMLLHVARWDEGIAFTPNLRVRTIRSAVHSDLRWVGREAGSAARECLDELLAGRKPPRRVAYDHRGVAEAVRCGWADVGVCLRLVSEEAGLEFLSVRQETYDFCYPERFAEDRRLRALIDVVRSPAYRSLLGELPGYSIDGSGAIRAIAGIPVHPAPSLPRAD